MRKFKISSRLSLCFIIILVLSLAGNLLSLWQVHKIKESTSHIMDDHRQDMTVIRVYNDLLLIVKILKQGMEKRDYEILKKCSEEVLVFSGDAQNAIESLRYNKEQEQHKNLINSFVAVKESLPGHIQKILELAELGDWFAVELRLKNQVEPFIERMNANVNLMKDEVKEENESYIKQAEEVENKSVFVIFITTIIILIVSAAMGFSVTKSIVTPLKELDEGAKSVSSGNFLYKVETNGHDELTTMAETFNQMNEQLRELYGNLENKVAERTRDLEEKNRELIETQEKLIEAEKLNTISQMIVSISHEINNPLTAVLGNIMLLGYEKDTISREELGTILKTTEEQVKRIAEVMEKLKKVDHPVTKTYLPGMEMIDLGNSE